MRRRAIALLATAAFVAVSVSWPSAIASAAPGDGTITLSTHRIVPGDRVLVSGTGWPAGFHLSGSLCGADAIDGSEDCAQATTIPLVAGQGGEVWSWMTTTMPPAPCPCVILINGVTNPYRRTIPVTVEGAPTAPLPSARKVVEPNIRVTDFKVVASTSLASSLGAAAKRTVEFNVYNPTSSLAWTPIAIGRWGSGTSISHVISMPSVGTVVPGGTKHVTASFTLPAFSIGTYNVRVVLEVVGYQVQASGTTSTSQWPILLFILLVVLLLLLIWLFVRRRRARWRAAAAAQAAVEGTAAEPVANAEASDTPSASDDEESEAADDAVDEPGGEPVEAEARPGP